MVNTKGLTNNLKNNYSFTTEEIKSDTFYFDLQGDEPIKLGDGSFGVVYQVHDETLQKFAVKLLYENQALEQAIIQPRLDNEILEDFCNYFNLSSESDPVVKKIIHCQELIDNISLFTFRLLQTGINEEQYLFLLEKILTNHRSVAVERFMDEIRAAKEIRAYLQSMGTQNLLQGVIETLGGTKKFRSSPAYLNLKQNFQASQIHVSDYALVMPLYNKTLKELLEDGIGKYSIRQSTEVIELLPTVSSFLLDSHSFTKEELEEKIDQSTELPESQKQILQANIYEYTGYDILSSMNFEERISTILPYLIRVTIGLNALYAAELSHLDLKPANIFVKDSEIFDVVIGDLGFLKSEKAPTGTVMSTVRDYLPLGTRHYRSPEQKDYFDICNVEIRQGQDAAGKPRVTLIGRDPKFRDSIIEESDYLVFSRDAAHFKYEIDQIIPKNDDSTVITLKLNPQAQEHFKPERQTQVILYKRQGIRSDLFGIGAMALDMLTCGGSPERFYENIRAYDNGHQDIATLMQLYRGVSNFQSSDPRLIHVFEPFKHQKFSNYAPFDMVELILKCMMYKTQQTFYEANQGQIQKQGNYNPTMKAVLDYLKKLAEKYQAKYDDNPLKKGTLKPSTKNQSSILSQRIKDLQKLPLNQLHLRLSRGIWYFKELVQLLGKSIKNEQIFLSELLPENILINNNKMEFSYTVYQKESDYHKDLRNDSVYTKIMRDITNPFVPNYITFIRRSIFLEAIPQTNAFKYTFSDSSLLGNQLSLGDWIIINSQLWKIIHVSGTQITLENEEGEQNLDLQSLNEDSISYIYYKNIDPCTYYCTMLGLYLYQIFIAGLGEATVDKPLLVNIAQSRFYLKDGSHFVKLKEHSIQKNKAKDLLDPIFQLMAKIYLKLNFCEDENSYYQSNDNDQERLLAVASDVEELQEMIANFVEVRSVALNDLFSEDFSDSKTELFKTKGKILDSFPEKLEFNSLINSFLTIDLSEQSLSKKIWHLLNTPVKDFITRSTQLSTPVDSDHNGKVKELELTMGENAKMLNKRE